MAEKLLPRAHTWRFPCAAPAREVFAVMEQMTGTPPYRFEAVGPGTARIVEFERLNVIGAWSNLARRAKDGTQRVDPDGTPQWRRPVRWVTVTATDAELGTEVVVEASKGRFTVARSLQLIQLLTRGTHDRRTIYRDRRIPDGPTTLVASWAGMLYHVYTEPTYTAPRGQGVLTASRLEACGNVGPFVRVRLEDGTVGYIERDQLVPAPAEATRAAQERAAALG